MNESFPVPKNASLNIHRRNANIHTYIHTDTMPNENNLCGRAQERMREPYHTTQQQQQQYMSVIDTNSVNMKDRAIRSMENGMHKSVRRRWEKFKMARALCQPTTSSGNAPRINFPVAIFLLSWQRWRFEWISMDAPCTNCYRQRAAAVNNNRF